MEEYKKKVEEEQRREEEQKNRKLNESKDKIELVKKRSNASQKGEKRA